MVTYNDTTAARKAQEKINQQAQLLDVLLEHIPAGVAVVEPVWADKGESVRIVDFQVVKANSALERIMGRPISEVVGQSIVTLFNYTSAATLLLYCTESIEGGSAQTFDMLLNQRDYQVSVTAKGNQLLLTFTETN